MKKFLITLAAIIALLIPAAVSAQVFSQSQLINKPYGAGVVISSTTGVAGHLEAVATSSLNISTTNIVEGAKLFFTNARVIAATLTGYVSSAGTISSADSILSAIQKLNGNIAALVTGVSSVFGRTGAVIAQSGDYTTAQVTESGNLYYTDARVNAYIHASTTIPKMYTANTFSLAQTFSVAPIFSSLTGVLKGNGASALTIAANGTDFTLITAKTCSGSDFVSAVTAAGVFTCTTPAGTTYTGAYPISVSGSVISSAFSTTSNSGMSQGSLYVGSGGIFQTVASSSIFGYTPEQPLTFSFPLSRSTNAVSSLFSTTTNNGMTAGFLYSGSGGIWQTAASSSFFGYIPLNPTRQLTVAGTAGQITSSAGAQDLSADRTWTFSLPNHVIFPGNFQVTNSTTTNATTTSLAVLGSTTVGTIFQGAGLSACTGTNALTWSAGSFGCGAQPQGTVTAVSVASANGFAGSSGGGATPALTISTTITGLLKGNGTAISAAALTDFPTQAANTVIGNGTGATAVPTALATSSLFAGSNSQILARVAGTWVGVATTTNSCSSGITCAYTAGNNAFSIGSNALTLAMFPTIAANTIIGNLTGSTATPTAFATSTLFTGTVGQSAYFASTGGLVGTSSLFMATSGNIGIGSTTPWANLSVASASYNYVSPLFAVATSSDTFGSIFTVFSTTTEQSAIGIIAGDISSMVTTGVRIVIGNFLTYRGLILDQLNINGRINTGDWFLLECSGAEGLNGNTNTSNFCGGWHSRQDSAGTAVGFGNINSMPIRFSIPANSVNSGIGMFYGYGASTGGSGFSLGTTTPIIEAVVSGQILVAGNNLGLATSTAYVGFGNAGPGSSALETPPTAGCFFTASSTENNWKAMCINGANMTIVDTGISSTTANYIRFRIETSLTSAKFYTQTTNTQLTVLTTISGSSYTANTAVTACIYVARATGGLLSDLWVSSARLWVKKTLWVN